MEMTQAIHAVRPSFGYRRVAHRILVDTGWKVSNKRILRCMQKLGIQSRIRRKHKCGIGKEHMIFSNLLKRNFRARKPMEKVAVDVTYLYCRGKVQYMSVFLDLYNNEILEYQVGNRNDMELIIHPLKRLLQKRKMDVTTATTIHSDQGNQFTSKPYNRLLQQYGIRQSMSRKGTPLDNAAIESFFGLFKNELYTDYRPNNLDELRTAIHAHTRFYNHERPQSRLKNKAPIPFRTECL